MNTEHLRDGTVVPKDLVIGLMECRHWVYKASEASAALRGLEGVIGDHGYPVNPDNLPGLSVAIRLIGESLESHACGRQARLEVMVRERSSHAAKRERTRAIPIKEQRLNDTPPVPADLGAGLREANYWACETSKISCALRALADVIGDSDNPVDPSRLPGLSAAVSVVADALDLAASERHGLNEMMVREHHALGKAA
jgi:hypothetical protein